MRRRRKTRASGVLTVVVLVGAAVILVLGGNWLKGRQPRRVPVGSSDVERSAPSDHLGEIHDDERHDLEQLLEKGDRR